MCIRDSCWTKYETVKENHGTQRHFNVGIIINDKELLPDPFWRAVTSISRPLFLVEGFFFGWVP